MFQLSTGIRRREDSVATQAIASAKPVPGPPTIAWASSESQTLGSAATIGLASAAVVTASVAPAPSPAIVAVTAVPLGKRPGAVMVTPVTLPPAIMAVPAAPPEAGAKTTLACV